MNDDLINTIAQLAGLMLALFAGGIGILMLVSHLLGYETYLFLY